jgi:hypothetical protein
MCMDCENEHIAECLAHIETCKEVDCKLCAAIHAEMQDGTFYMSLAEREFNRGIDY